jgi:RNA polymerase sigma factor (sigma-70 family)
MAPDPGAGAGPADPRPRPGQSRLVASEALLASAQAGDREALSTLLSDSQPHVRRFAQRWCPTAEDAEDATQEALILLFRRVGSLRAAGALASWLITVVRRECLRRGRRLVLQASVSVTSVPASDSSEDVAVRRLEAERVAQAIAQLPAQLRHVVVLRDLYGYPTDVTAAMINVSEAATKARLHRARRSLACTLSETAPSPAGQNR